MLSNIIWMILENKEIVSIIYNATHKQSSDHSMLSYAVGIPGLNVKAQSVVGSLVGRSSII